MSLINFFLPHPQTHKKAHLISIPALFVYICLFIVLQLGLSALQHFKPGVLGISSSVEVEQLIDLTNQQRQKEGLAPLKENSELDKAAQAKGENMFAENYWAHYSPSGKDPWGFIQGAGYKFSYAGENLARNFYTSSDVVNAWMASPSHKANIVNSHYEDIGIAVLEGNLQGQKTVLVVQEFGTPVETLAQAPVINAPPQNLTPTSEQQVLPVTVQSSVSKPSFAIDPYKLTKSVGSGIIFMVMFLLLLDLYIIRRRAVVRLTSRHLPHLALLSVAASALFNMHPGGIL